MTIPHLGCLEELVVLAVQRLQPVDHHDVRLDLAGITGKNTSGSAIHTTMNRLVQKGCLEKHRTLIPDKPGKYAHWYAVSDLGLAALEQAEDIRFAVRRGKPKEGEYGE
jgi:predicted transcriptional regulator